VSKPSWEEIYHVVPMFYRDNGASSPFRFLYPFIYSRRIRADIAFCSRIHDFGYGPARLSGSPSGLWKLTKKDWDEKYREALIARGRVKIAKVHCWALKEFGSYSWSRFDRRMNKMGWQSYSDWFSWASEGFSKGETYQFYNKLEVFREL